MDIGLNYLERVAGTKMMNSEIEENYVIFKKKQAHDSESLLIL